MVGFELFLKSLLVAGKESSKLKGFLRLRLVKNHEYSNSLPPG